MRAGLISSSWAMSWGSTGSSATMRMASMARRASSAIVGVHGGHRGGRGGGDPGDLEVAEQRALVELDEALLVELEHGEEADDDLEALGQVLGQVPERDAPGARQLVDQLVDRVAHAGPDRG